MVNVLLNNFIISPPGSTDPSQPTDVTTRESVSTTHWPMNKVTSVADSVDSGRPSSIQARDMSPLQEQEPQEIG